jgi:mutator protein MutT
MTEPGSHRFQKIAVAILEHQGRYLVGQRPPGVALAGQSEFPGGKVHGDESPADAAARECLEETGLQIQVVRRFAVVQHEYEHGRLELHFFSCRLIDPDALPQPPFRWVDAEALKDHHFPAANAEVLKMLAELG